MYLLDNDTVSGAFREQARISRRLLVTPADQLWISPIVVEESVGQQINRINTLRSKGQPLGSACRLLVQLVSHLCTFQILPYGDEAERLYKSWTAQQKRVGANDGRIAASALIAGFIVVTCNGKDFSRLPDVLFEDWSR